MSLRFTRNQLSPHVLPIKRPITIVSGLPRSGTSMMMAMLEAGGIPALQDGIRTADPDNPNGYYELEQVKKLNKGDIEWVSNAQGKAVKVISALLSFLPNQYQYNVLFMERSLEEVLASQSIMLTHRGNDQLATNDQLKLLYQQHLEQVEHWIATRPNVNAIRLSYAQLAQQPMSQLPKINQFLGGNLNIDAMYSIVNPELYRNRKN